MIKQLYTFFILMFFLLIAGLSIEAQEEINEDDVAEIETATDEESSNDNSDQSDTEEEEETIASIVEGLTNYQGAFDLYHDEESGDVMMVLRGDQLDQEYIYFSYAVNGLVQTPFFRGGYGSNRIISFRESYGQIEFVFQNPSYYFDPESPLSRASNANIGYGILGSVSIVLHDEEEDLYLLDITNLLKSESLSQLSYINDDDSFSIGGMSPSKTKVTSVRSYPENSDIRLEYTFDNPVPRNGGGSPVADDRYVSIFIQHSFIQMPEDDFIPRLTDHRMGYFANEITDLTQDDPTPYRDLVERWNLQKVNPLAELSPPVEPIVWWIENTTPFEFREAVAEGVLAWNTAFEKIGFENAIEVRVQPDDADWDAGDIRYNVLSWSSSPFPPFSGYGPSFSNPRTGQIIGADIMLEYAPTLRRVQYQRILDNLDGSLYAEENFEAYCTYAFDKQISLAFGRIFQPELRIDNGEEEAVLHQFIVDLVMHEVGHTLGLAHNFGGTFLLSPEESYDNSIISEGVLYSSVMDYTDIHISPARDNEQFFNTAVGPYDDWVIEYAYSESLADPTEEANRLNDIASRSSLSENLFGTDDHNMRAPGWGSDPRIQWYDMTNDPMQYASDRIGLINDASEDLLNKFLREGESYHELRDAYVVLLGQFSRAANTIVKFIGGVEVHRGLYEEDQTSSPLIPTSYEDQARAMSLLDELVFAPNAFDASNELYDYLLADRRLWNLYGFTEDPKIREWILDIQRGVLQHLLNPRVMTRISDSMSYGNDYSLNEMMESLTNAIFEDDIRGNVNLIRQSLQALYIDGLDYTLNNSQNSDFQARAAALNELERIQGLLERKRSGDASTRAHTNYLLYLIDHALDIDA
jgi:hypothetical protein